ncbi:TetR family transcriptional regulator [Desmospora sp. 8437]|uniref:Uncharacterized protein n=1 Tax=Kroppenstedtia eburnea TaxID=714067 RepID=A0A1N7IZG3_9BACL|nr:TetR family transcriptional regulator [Desmospora sp. 8437]SIS42429.1 hypothetical protein SAMN05421790_101544 [Kroppenstedtia eburnea]
MMIGKEVVEIFHGLFYLVEGTARIGHLKWANRVPNRITSTFID